MLTSLVIPDNFSNCVAQCWWCFIQSSVLSTVDGKVVVYHGCNRVRDNQCSILEKEPEKQLAHLGKAAGTKITQSQDREVVARSNCTMS